MSLRLSEILYNFIIKLIYFYSLILGVVPGTFDWQTYRFKVSKFYLVYSALIQFGFLAIIPITSSFVHDKNNYMHNKPVLQWAYMVAKLAMVSTVVIISVKIWKKRQRFVAVCDVYKRFVFKYSDFSKHFHCYITEDLKQQDQRLKRFMIYKFISLHVHTLAITSMYVQMQEDPDRKFFIMITVNMLQGFFLITANLQFMFILCQMSLHFSYINHCLQVLQHQKIPLKNLLNYYLILYEMHMECLQISRLFFGASNAVTFFMLLKIFTTNVTMLYHAVLIIMSNIHSTNTSSFVGVMCIVNFYWDSLLVTAAIDYALAACNRSMDIIQETWFEDSGGEDHEMTFRKLTQVVSVVRNENLNDLWV
ncbi:putative gustatory receptor 58b [Calliphora vicina]|uniref:putative gustatory receptor 58b n=1 Tax=Calliphora vicina TaxID=7373 RepID=UPI00325BB96E